MSVDLTVSFRYPHGRAVHTSMRLCQLKPHHMARHVLSCGWSPWQLVTATYLDTYYYVLLMGLPRPNRIDATTGELEDGFCFTGIRVLQDLNRKEPRVILHEFDSGGILYNHGLPGTKIRVIWTGRQFRAFDNYAGILNLARHLSQKSCTPSCHAMPCPCFGHAAYCAFGFAAASV